MVVGGEILNGIRILSVCLLTVNCLLVCPPKLHTENTINWTAFREGPAVMATEAAFGVRGSAGQSGDTLSTAAGDCWGLVPCSSPQLQRERKGLALKMFCVPWSMLEMQDFSRSWTHFWRNCALVQHQGRSWRAAPHWVILELFLPHANSGKAKLDKNWIGSGAAKAVPVLVNASWSFTLLSNPVSETYFLFLLLTHFMIRTNCSNDVSLHRWT